MCSLFVVFPISRATTHTEGICAFSGGQTVALVDGLVQSKQFWAATRQPIIPLFRAVVTLVPSSANYLSAFIDLNSGAHRAFYTMRYIEGYVCVCVGGG